jgi:hypothetical protein
MGCGIRVVVQEVYSVNRDLMVTGERALCGLRLVYLLFLDSWEISGRNLIHHSLEVNANKKEFNNKRCIDYSDKTG